MPVCRLLRYTALCLVEEIVEVWIWPSRPRETETNRRDEKKTERTRQEHTESDPVSVSGVVIKAASNTQECRNVRWRLSHQVERARRGGESVSLFQEGTDTAGPSEDSNIATRGGKTGRQRYHFCEEWSRTTVGERQRQRRKNVFELNPDWITPKSFTANEPRPKG